jgi:hypothetical protein
MSARTIATAAVLVTASSAHAALTLLSGPQLGTHTGNLVTNGSFETGAPAPNAPVLHWATGTTLTPFGVPPTWSSSGATNTYAYWGGVGGGPYTIATSDYLPDGSAGLYFGNGAGATVNQPPTFNPDGTVSFPSPPPTFTPVFSTSCNLWQTVPTHLNPSPSYLLSFWASGEDAGTIAQPGVAPGIFGLKVTNVLPGDPIQYLQVPGSATNSRRFEYQFTPINPLAPVTVEFINWGHMNLSQWGGPGGTTELVLDDVIVNTVPAPAAGPWACVAAAALIARRRRRR